MVTSAERRWLLIVSSGVLVLASLPYVMGALSATPDWVFTGLQVNPLDGVSYLAKMRLGFNGSWTFHLVYTVEQGPGAFVYTFYLALGQLARLFNLPLIVIFHLARILGGLTVLWLAYHLIARVTDRIDQRRRAWWLVALSSGLGWLATLLGHGDSSDMTIPESNTFYSLLTNAHFALAAAIMLAIFIGVFSTRRLTGLRLIGLSGLSLILAMMQPFASFVLYGILGVALLLIWRRDRLFPRTQSAAAFIAGLVTAPLLLYIYFAMQADAMLRTWLAQNQTPSPPLIDYALGYGLLLVTAIPGARLAWRRRSDWDLLLLAWIVLTALLLYAPIPLQRRLALGLHLPIAILAAQGLEQLFRSKWPRRFVMAATLPTSLLIVLALFGGAVTHDRHIFISANEAAAFNWLQINVPPDTVVLAAPETGAFIPAFAGQRVVYGHPYETVDADRQKQLVTDFFAGRLDRLAMLRAYSINYVLVGPRERALGQFDAAALPVRSVYTSGDVAVYAVEP